MVGGSSRSAWWRDYSSAAPSRVNPTLTPTLARGVWHDVAGRRGRPWRRISTRQFTGTRGPGGRHDGPHRALRSSSQPGPTRRAFLGAGALTLLGLAAPPLIRPAAAQTPKRGGTLVVAADVSPPGLDPQKSAAAHSWMIAEHVYSTLLRRDPQMNIVGDLAESWQVVNDTTFVFKLRKGVVWHHGRDLVADDVKYSFERMLDEKTASPWRSNWSIIDRIEAPDRSTVRFVIKRPFAPFFSYLATPHYSGHRPARPRARSTATSRRTPPAPGPSCSSGSSRTTRSSSSGTRAYYEPGLPYLDGLEYRIIPDEARRAWPRCARAPSTTSGPSTRSSTGRSRAPPASCSASRTGTAPSTAWPSTRRSPFTDVRVRRAVSAGINRREIIASVLRGPRRHHARRSRRATRPFGYSGDDKGLPYYAHDPALARRLLGGGRLRQRPRHDPRGVAPLPADRPDGRGHEGAARRGRASA